MEDLLKNDNFFPIYELHGPPLEDEDTPKVVYKKFHEMYEEFVSELSLPP